MHQTEYYDIQSIYTLPKFKTIQYYQTKRLLTIHFLHYHTPEVH